MAVRRQAEGQQSCQGLGNHPPRAVILLRDRWASLLAILGVALHPCPLGLSPHTHHHAEGAALEEEDAE